MMYIEEDEEGRGDGVEMMGSAAWLVPPLLLSSSLRSPRSPPSVPLPPPPIPPPPLPPPQPPPHRSAPSGAPVGSSERSDGHTGSVSRRGSLALRGGGFGMSPNTPIDTTRPLPGTSVLRPRTLATSGMKSWFGSAGLSGPSPSTERAMPTILSPIDLRAATVASAKGPSQKRTALATACVPARCAGSMRRLTGPSMTSALRLRSCSVAASAGALTVLTAWSGPPSAAWLISRASVLALAATAAMLASETGGGGGLFAAAGDARAAAARSSRSAAAGRPLRPLWPRGAAGARMRIFVSLWSLVLVLSLCVRLSQDCVCTPRCACLTVM